MEQAYRVSHHTGLVRILRGAFAGVGQTNVVTDLMELSTGIVAPLVVVHRQIPIDVGVGDPSTAGARGEALHDIVELPRAAPQRCIRGRLDSITDCAIGHTGDGLTDGDLVDTAGNGGTTVRGSLEGQEVKLAVATGGVLT